MTAIPVKPADPMRDFQDKLAERVRNDIRELMPEEAVAALVQKAVEQEFFAPRTVVTGGWNSRTEERPSWFVEEVVKTAAPIIKAAVEKCVRDHPAVVERAIADFLDANKLAVMTTTQLTGMLQSALFELQQMLRS